MSVLKNFVIEGLLEKVYEVERAVIEDLEQQGYDENALFSIRLALDEALINALKHGNRNDPNKTLRVTYESEGDRVTISVEDEGEGFDHENLMDPTQGEMLRRTHGRGIYLIRQFMDEVQFNERGNRITFSYRRAPTRSGEFLGLRWTQREDVLVLCVEEPIPPLQVDQWVERIARFIQEGQRKVIVDLSQLEFVNTSFLSLLVMIARSTKSEGGKCGLCNAQKNALRVLKTTNLDQLIPIYADMQSALDAMKGESANTA